ncbi:zinc-dependent metalloprotease [Pseudokineococcus basanitobsidens]|uniref:Zinc-dependent metalloprotease n=1 Tax=Pseudokineococcus basanitobsidens TaxID=1926649 RepID=A0ABU8RGE8_9ACTN
MTGTTAQAPLVDQLVDWELAVSVAGRLAAPGPEVSRAEADRAVAQLRRLAERATGHVGETSGLHVAPDTGAVVVDRRGWARANAAAFRALLEEPVVAARDARRARDEREGRTRREDGPGAAAATAVARRASGAEVGALLAYLAPRVLGQYDPFGPDPVGPGASTGTGATGSDGVAPAGGGRTTGTPDEPGRLLLVAPNVVAVERELRLRPRDFRLWVCLHEETHRVQFTAAPWLAPHLRARTQGLVTDVVGGPGELAARLRSAVARLPAALGEDGDGLVGLLATPEQRRVVEEVTAVMSLLEGHADVVMDAVGPAVVPSVETIRARFTARRGGRPGLDRVVRRLLGMDAKMRQYRDGASFVRGVLEDVGFDGLNAVWTGPEHLPTPAEIADPRAWVRRVHG